MSTQKHEQPRLLPNGERRKSTHEEVEAQVRLVLGSDEHLTDYDIEHIISAMQNLECLGTQSYIREEDLYHVFNHCKFNCTPELIEQKLKILNIVPVDKSKNEKKKDKRGYVIEKEPGISLNDFSKLYMHMKNLMLSSGLTESEMFGVEVVEDKHAIPDVTGPGQKRRISMTRNMMTDAHSDEERVAFSSYINNRLNDDPFFKDPPFFGSPRLRIFKNNVFRCHFETLFKVNTSPYLLLYHFQ